MVIDLKEIDKGYAEAHREHMAHEIARQDKEWKQLNKRDRSDQVFFVLSWIIGMITFIFSACLVAEQVARHFSHG